MSSIWTFYLAGGIATVIMAYYMLFIPITQKVDLILQTANKNTKSFKNATTFRQKNILTVLVFSIAVFILFPLILVPLFSDQFREGFIESFVEGAIND